MKIRKLHLKNIGVFDDETEPIEFKEIEFNKGKEIKDRKAEIHILTGENGTGKTTILEALANSIKSDSIKIWDRLIQGDDQTFLKRLRTDCELNVKPDLDNDGPLQLFRQLYALGLKGNKLIMLHKRFSFASFAYSGYRKIKDVPLEIGKENDENPLYQALEFVKDENSNFNVNQWLGGNLLDYLIFQTDDKEKAKNIDEKIKRFEKIINDIITNETRNNEVVTDEIEKNKIKFRMQSSKKLVLVKNGEDLDFNVLPDGLKSLISWIGDLLMRLDSLAWKDDTPIFDREIILFLDEIEVHLHPAWQRKVLPVVQKLFKNAQIFVSTHSPFVVNSVDDAWVYKLKVEDGKAKVESVERSEDARSYRYVLRNTFDIENEFGIEIENRLKEFYKERDSILAENGNSKKAKSELKKIANELSKQGKELKSKIDFELFQLSEITGEDF